jgi:allene oxide cyclase
VADEVEPHEPRIEAAARWTCGACRDISLDTLAGGRRDEMTKSRIAVVAAVAVAAAVALALAGCGGGGGGQTITVIEHATTDVTTDTGAKDDSAGDVLTFANEVFDADNTDKVGTDQGFCIRTEVGKGYECLWTTFLEGGQITVEGPFFDTTASTLAITGGTGDYADAEGTMDLSAANADATEFKFVFNIK